MKIAIDLSLAVGERSGVGNYSYNLVKSLSHIDHVNQYILLPFFYYIYHLNFKNLKLDITNPNFKIKYNKLPKEWIDYIWNNELIARNDVIGDVDILHSTSFCVPDKIKSKLVVTIYDVSFVTHPEFHQKENIEHCLEGTKKAVEKADIIIAISEHTKKDLIKYFDCPESKIKVTYLGYDKEIFRVINKEEKIKEVLKKYNIQNPFIFNLGTIEPRKNIEGLIKAYSLLPQDLRDSYDLVIAGGRGWLNSSIYSLVEKLNLQKKINFLGYVDDQDLPYFYNATECFVYPSFYEGFGLPVVEALACGCPVICSNTSSLPEVIGDSGILIDPKDGNMLSSSIVNVLQDKVLKENLKKEALIQSQKFSWESCAEQTLNIYKAL